MDFAIIGDICVRKSILNGFRRVFKDDLSVAIVNHPLRQKNDRGLSYFPYIFYFVNFTISAAI